MTNRTFPILVGVLLLFCVFSNAQTSESSQRLQDSGTVELNKGDLYMVRSPNVRIGLTNCRCVSTFDLDKGVLAFVRTLPSTVDGHRTSTITVLDTSTNRVIVTFAPPFKYGGRQFNGEIAGVGLDQARGRLYALMADGSTTHTIVRFELNGKANLVDIGYALAIRCVRSGKYAGAIVALLRKAKLSSGMWYAYFLIDPDGREIGFVGPTEADVEDFLMLQLQ